MTEIDLDFFGEETYVTTCYVAGIQFRQGWQETVERLEEGQALILEQEPENKYDPTAVRILASFDSGEIIHLGYVPAKSGQAKQVFDLLTKQTQLSCRVLEADPNRSPWHAVGILIEEGGESE